MNEKIPTNIEDFIDKLPDDHPIKQMSMNSFEYRATCLYFEEAMKGGRTAESSYEIVKTAQRFICTELLALSSLDLKRAKEGLKLCYEAMEEDMDIMFKEAQPKIAEYFKREKL